MINPEAAIAVAFIFVVALIALSVCFDKEDALAFTVILISACVIAVIAALVIGDDSEKQEAAPATQAHGLTQAEMLYLAETPDEDRSGDPQEAFVYGLKLVKELSGETVVLNADGTEFVADDNPSGDPDQVITRESLEDLELGVADTELDGEFLVAGLVKNFRWFTPQGWWSDSAQVSAHDVLFVQDEESDFYRYATKHDLTQ